MSELVTIELNQNNAHIVRDNGDYVVKLGKPIEVTPGDLIRMRMASIDSQKAQSNTVVIPNDINLGITYSYYDYDYTVTNKTSYNANNPANNWLGDTWLNEVGGPTFDYYAMYGKTPIVTFSTATCNILSAIPPSYDSQLSLQVSGTFLIDRSTARAQGYTIPESFEFQVTVQYIDEDGDYQQAVLTGSNATFGRVPGAPGTAKNVFYNGGNSFNISKVGGGTFTYQKGTMSVMGVTGLFVGGNGSQKRQQNDIPTESGSNPPSRTVSPVDSANTEVEMPYFRFTFNESVSNPGTMNLRLNTQGAVLKAGTYDPASLAIQLTQLFNNVGPLFAQGGANDRGPLMGENQMLTITDQGNNVETIFRKVDFTTASANISFDQGITYHYQLTTAGNPLVPTYVGASKFIVDYGQQAGEVFAITNMHMPLEVPLTGAPANPPAEAVAYIATRTGANVGGSPAVHWNAVRLASGIAIHQLEPQDFWQNTIGIYDQVIVPLYEDPNGKTKFYLKADLESHITYGFDSRQGFLLPSGTSDDWRNAPITAVDGYTVWIDTEAATYSILGDTVQTKSTGYFLVEIQGLTRRREGFVDNVNANPAILACVSTQFDSNDRVTGFADSGLDYAHVGDGYLISDLAVRILDPDTKQVVANLGTENAVLVDIIKGGALPPAPVPPVLPSGRK